MKKRARESCEMCSTEVDHPTTIKVAGALLRVCAKCTSFGNVVADKPSAVKKQPVSRTKARPSRSPPIRRSSFSRPKKVEKELVGNFDTVIKNARLLKKLSHERLSSLTGITVATLKSIESGKMRPTDNDARVIQRELNISLFIELDIEPDHADKRKKKATTLGDIAVFKKFDYGQN